MLRSLYKVILLALVLQWVLMVGICIPEGVHHFVVEGFKQAEAKNLRSAMQTSCNDYIEKCAFENNSNGFGSLRMILEPEGARNAGALWRRMGTTLWHSSGEIEGRIPTGDYVIEFNKVNGWENPASPSVVILPGLPGSFTGHYARLQGIVLHVDGDNQSGIYEGTELYPYDSIQTAVENSASGDSIKTAVGVYGQVNTMGKALTFLGGYPGADPETYASGLGGDFSRRDMDPEVTVISGGFENNGLVFTRFDDAPYHGLMDNFTVRQSRKGIVCDTESSWPHPDNLTITNTIVENNGRDDEQNMYSGAGVILCGGNNSIYNSIIRSNRGGWGAGILSRGGEGTLHIQDNRIEDNICYVDSCHGAGLTLFSGEKILTGNLISGNRIDFGYGWGGGVFATGSGVTQMSSNIIRNNYAPSYGGGVFIDGATAFMSHDLVHHNSSGDYGGAGIAVDDEHLLPAHVHLINCTIAHNTSTDIINGGNGVYLDSGSTAVVTNSIFWGNGDDFYVRPGMSSSLNMTWSLSEETWPGDGNQHTDPLFADADGWDFHLRSFVGRYHPQTGSWVKDVQHSPAIDAGDPASSFVGEPRPNGSRINMGMYGNTPQASMGLSMAFPGVLMLLLNDE